MQDAVLARCQAVFDTWGEATIHDFEFDDPKGFSSFTMGVRSRRGDVEPPAVLYRHLDGKENAILDFEREKQTFLLLGEHEIAAHCYHYADSYRLEQFYEGRTLTADDVLDPSVQHKIAAELHRLHQLRPPDLPQQTFFELLHAQWGALAESVLTEHVAEFPPDEQVWCEPLRRLYSEQTLAKVMRCLPEREPVFCHNDTYHGNVFKLTNGSIKLLDFEFSCLNHAVFDFANLFAETAMLHGFNDPPHFKIGPRPFDDEDLRRFIGFYLDHEAFSSDRARDRATERLLLETRRALLLPDFMYAMAALPLALEPIQKIRFIPYAHHRFEKFLRSWDEEFESH